MPRLLSAAALAERLCRPQRVGLFGHRGVGKTTFLTVLYREAVGGRVPELRLAAGDASTANYLADKVLALESGSILPATLAESELRFQIYRHGARLEVIVKDYQGEHVAVGREEPVREFLCDCDAVWLCFDPAMLGSTSARLHGEQEAEQMIEDYLKLDRSDCPHRPMALVLTKADLLPPHQGQLGDDAWIEKVVRDHFGMTLHALKEHAPSNGLFAVSSLGPRQVADGSQGPLHPQNLDRPLRWLLEALQAQDEARLDRLFQLAPRNARLLERCVRCFRQRHTSSPRIAEFELKLRKARAHQRVHRVLTGVLTTGAVLAVLWTMDRIRYQNAVAFERSNDDLTAIRSRWQHYEAQPLGIGSKEPVRQRLRDLEVQIRDQKRARDLAALRSQTSNSESRSGAVLTQLQLFRDEHPDAPGLDQLRDEILEKVRPLRDREAREALDDLSKHESVSGSKREGEAARQHLEDLVARADRALEEFRETPTSQKLRERRKAYVQRIDEHDFQEARAYSKTAPLNFATRRERFQQYLSRHPQGTFATEARAAVSEVEMAWDRHDFRQIRNLFVKNPADFAKLTSLSDRYLAVHENGKFRKPAKDLLSWIGRVNGPREYSVKAVKGDFSKKLGRWFTKGPDLSVEIEVNGIKHGPTNIVKNNYDPNWDYEFPRPVKWQPGDQVRIRIFDKDFSTVGLGRIVLDHSSDESDKLAMRLLSGKVEFDEHAIWFESDLRMPELPRVD